MVDDRSVRAFLDAGADLAGGVLGAAAGAAAGDPGVAIAGTAVGVTITHAVRAVGDRLLSRERARAAAVLWGILEDAEERRSRGQTPREDGFFEPSDEGRPEAEELLEGVLRQAAESWEERKLPFLAHLWSTTAHDETVRAADARYFTRLAANLTYRQFVALGVFYRRNDHVRELARAASLRDEGRATVNPVVLVELDELARLGLIGVRASGSGVVRDPAGLLGGNAASQSAYGTLRLTDAGLRFAELLGLASIGRAERDEWVGRFGVAGRADQATR